MRVSQSSNGVESRSETKGAKGSAKSHTASDGAKAVKGQGKSSISEESVKPEISQRSREFANAKSVASSAPDVREEKIAEIKKRIAEGKYHVNEDAVADRMVDDHLRMSGLE